MTATTVLIISNGRWDYLLDTIESAVERLRGAEFDVLALLDVDEATAKGAPEALSVYADEVLVTGGASGVDGAIRAAWAHLRSRSSLDYVFHLEEDFTFNVTLDLDFMVSVLDRLGPSCRQLALKRQPWFTSELRAGDMLGRFDWRLFEDVTVAVPATEATPPERRVGALDHVRVSRHRLFWTANPCLYSADLIRRFDWPTGARSERRFGELVLAEEGAFCAYLGHHLDPPLVEHIGGERTGIRY